MIELLARPYQGRWIAGVCRAIENAYGVPVWLVRTVAIVAFFAAPFVLLLYLLLAISIPSERGSASSLYFRASSLGAQGFAGSATLLLDRTAARLRTTSSRQRTIVPLLFLFTLLFGLPKLEGTMFYQLHPLMDTLYTAINRLASVLLYFLVGLMFLLRANASRRPVVLKVVSSESFALEATEFKSIGGIAMGISRATHIDVSIVRVILLLLNFLTIGIIGALYFLVVWILRGRMYGGENNTIDTADVPEEPSMFNSAMAAIFILLAIVRVATEFRWFFFNEPFVRGLLLCIAGVVLSKRALSLAILAGAVLLFLGVHDISVASFHVQPTASSRWIINYIILALAISYYALIALKNNARLVGFAFAAVPVVAALVISTHIVSEPFLLALGRFYDFFSPLIFSALALWVAMES